MRAVGPGRVVLLLTTLLDLNYASATKRLSNKGIRLIFLYPPKCLHDLAPLAGLYTRK